MQKLKKFFEGFFTYLSDPSMQQYLFEVTIPSVMPLKLLDTHTQSTHRREKEVNKLMTTLRN